MSMRIIRDIPEAMHLANGMVVYDAMEDFITDDDYDHTTNDVLYAATDTEGTFEEIEGEQVKVSDKKELKAPDNKIKKRHTFAGWPAVGKDV